jgi:hypothetical protein
MRYGDDPKLMPHDDWHLYVFANLDAVSCTECEKSLSAEWAWRRGDAGRIAAQVAAMRIVERLKADGWTMRGGKLICHDCAAKPAD